MGYASVQHVPRLFTYERAKRLFDKTAPIRGTTIRPLGRRKDHRMYSIRENKEGHIELVCYNTPVVTFEQGEQNIVRVKIDGWNSISTRQFIQTTLGVPTSASKSYCILEIRGEKHTLRKDEELLLAWGVGEWTNGWTVLNNHQRLSYRINRKGANNVRAMYKPFTNYLKSFISLRATDMSVKGAWGRDDYEYKAVPLTLRELSEVFGIEDHAESVYAQGVVKHTSHMAKRTVTVPGLYALKQKQAKGHERKTEELLELIKSGDAVKFYKAALWLCNGGNDTRLAYSESEADKAVLFVASNLPMKFFDEFVMMHHAQETIEVYPTPIGNVPSEKYKVWLA